MTNVVLAAALALSPADFAQMTNRIDIMWTAHTNAVARREAFQRHREQTMKSLKKPRPFRVDDPISWRKRK